MCFVCVCVCGVRVCVCVCVCVCVLGVGGWVFGLLGGRRELQALLCTQGRVF